MLVGEAPGATEDKKLQPFVGRTGEEVNKHYLPLSGLKRADVLVSNAIACLPPGPDGKLNPKSAKDTALLQSCSECHLLPLIDAVRPKILVPMGNFACRALGIEQTLDLQHGIPLQTAYGKAFPMFHPAGGLYTPKSMLSIRTDWYRLGQYLKGKLQMPKDEYPVRDYRVVDSPDEFDELDVTQPLANDTESKQDGTPFCLTYSDRPGRARLVMADRPDLLYAFQQRLDAWENVLLWHNWQYDYFVTQKMGLRYNQKKVRDTMAVAFQIGNLPQGLKALCYRLLGLRMKDFDDLVTPHATPLVLNYYRDCLSEDWPKPEEQLVRDKDGAWKLYKPQSMTTKMKVFFTYYAKNPEKDVFEAWDNWEDSHEMIQERMGKWPGKCISYAPFEEAAWYAMEDSDGLRRLWPVFQHMIRRVRRTVQEKWMET